MQSTRRSFQANIFRDVIKFYEKKKKTPILIRCFKIGMLKNY